MTVGVYKKVNVPKGMVDWFREQCENSPGGIDSSSVDPPMPLRELVDRLEHLAQTGLLSEEDRPLYRTVLLGYINYQQESLQKQGLL